MSKHLKYTLPDGDDATARVIAAALNLRLCLDPPAATEAEALGAICREWLDAQHARVRAARAAKGGEE